MTTNLRVMPAMAFAFLATISVSRAQVPDALRTTFVEWTRKSAHPIDAGTLGGPTGDIDPVDEMIGAATIVGISEGQHGAAEPMQFRNRLFQQLAERAGFTAIALESGIVESRALNDYVTLGKGELDTVLGQGLSNGFHLFQPNRDLIVWMRAHNARLPRGAPRLQIFGLDVPGSPGNFDSVRKPDTALLAALDYLRAVDPQAATQLQARVANHLPVLAGIDGYGELLPSRRDELTAAIADLAALLERRQSEYTRKSSKEDFDWAMRAATGARQTDAWFRTMPVNWKPEQGFEWTRQAMQVRDRSMADNLEWVRDRLGPGARVLVFTASGHLAKTVVQAPSSPFREMTPLGSYLKTRHGADFVNILNLVANGEIHYCSSNPPRVLPLKPPPPSSIESLFGAASRPRYLLDLRRAPAELADWLHQEHDHWNGFVAMRFATAEAFDIAYYVAPLTPACRP